MAINAEELEKRLRRTDQLVALVKAEILARSEARQFLGLPESAPPQQVSL